MKVYELECLSHFYKSLVFSLMIGSCYDFLRCLFGKNKKISDCIFVISATILTVLFMVNIVGGSLRWYIILTAFLGIILYFFTVSKFVCFVLLFFTKKICIFLHLIFNFLLTVMQFLSKILVCVKKLFYVQNYRRGNKND